MSVFLQKFGLRIEQSGNVIYEMEEDENDKRFAHAVFELTVGSSLFDPLIEFGCFGNAEVCV